MARDTLRNLSVQQLQNLQENSEALNHFIQDSQEVQSVQLEKEMTLAANKRWAEQNLEFKPHLDSGRVSLSEKYQQLQDLLTQLQRKRSKLENVYGPLRPESILSHIQSEGSKTEEESDALAEKFLEGAVPLETFLDDFVSLRILSYLRRVKAEKLQETLRKQEAPSPQKEPPKDASFPRQPDPPMNPPSHSPPSFPLPYNPSPFLPGQPMRIGPVAQGGLTPAPFFGTRGASDPPTSQHRAQTSFQYGHSQPRLGGPGYPHFQPGGPGFLQPQSGGLGYPQAQFGGSAPQLTPYVPGGRPQCPYPNQPQLPRYPGSQPLPYPQYSGFPQPSPAGSFWSRYRTE
ncbi:vacuolar protein sorting-associated protein 37C isoform X2 [Rhinatrema bivittatum]|nr:vacuolar protein sorting-associated protein 37C isoform X2 [Rhinatrema bivittatum]XP_029430820.1 vacuolar protein sorting-associated protein 37C isoform X2 [Rhinatrema bivittatum]XP_029430821.1 vacuolar protein sorting-associated protein 37C isoform X2 [Rhinatrema bivittatum]